MKLAMGPIPRIRDTGESPLFVSPVSWNRENVLALLPLINCEQCGECCRMCKPIVVKPDEILRIADYLDIRASQLRRQLEPLRGYPDGTMGMPSPCPFQEDNLCTIRPARPVVCKYYPLQRVNYKGQECIAVSGFCDAGLECIEWLREKANGNAIS